MIQPGLERIGLLLKDVTFPWKAIHVAGTNGKGSICHYASLLLSRRTIRCGKFTSPHLIDRWDCITIGDKPVDEMLFRKIENHYTQLSQRQGINASPFEILTATAFHIFNEKKVEVGVVEVGMGGKLDATNILQNQAVSVISKIAQDHQSFLGNTLEEIAQHKAGILRPNVPYVVNPLNEWNVHDVIDKYAKDIGAGPRLSGDTLELREKLYSSQDWHDFAELLQPFQRDNAVLAILAVKAIARSLNFTFENKKIAHFLEATRKRPNPGRVQFLKVPPVFRTYWDGNYNAGRSILVDGAHNLDAAKALQTHVHRRERKRQIPEGVHPVGGWPVTWVLAMSEGKDAHQFLGALLRPGDNVIATVFGPVDGMPWVKPMDPKRLLEIAKSVQPRVTTVHMPSEGVLRALFAAKHLTEKNRPIVLTGSLYLVGDFYREMQFRRGKWWQDPDQEEDRALIDAMDKQERARINALLSGRTHESRVSDDDNVNAKKLRVAQEERARLLQEINTLDSEVQRLDGEEHRLSPSRSFESRKPLFTTTSSRPDFDPISKPMSSSKKSMPTSPKEKFSKEFEDIRRMIEALPDPEPSLETPSAVDESTQDDIQASPSVTISKHPSGHNWMRFRKDPVAAEASTGSENDSNDSGERDKSGNMEGGKARFRILKHLAWGDDKPHPRRSRCDVAQIYRVMHVYADK